MISAASNGMFVKLVLSHQSLSLVPIAPQELLDVVSCRCSAERKLALVRSAVATMGDFCALNTVTAREKMPAAIFIGSLSRWRRKKRKWRKRSRRRRRKKSLMKMTNWTRRKLTLNKK